mmetsp:Transcript_28997/g.47879  ORF Transcript_28997/g.47879 Transcript_28997/m.47879 type:complete len:1154 (+) Transcript_28997:149-3610(+)|eukprot:CAMPEP_0119004184 /NCGR_PEP_ID=MMETSP1176-20130426/1002_1 /TAXON_ID=265551 /ORGANISM="Synedropsis recta cf, Strain CCMP1620" /LENGTH=1153 /DNA_ID=CAMNT_0006955865 /DNA_START=100 /DNA_END=3561 /DNA_ORIENTATION=-
MWLSSILLPLLLLFTTSNNNNNIVVSAAKSEREILLEFYNTLNGDSWNINTGWEDDAKNICHWHGVICQGEEDDLEDDPDARRKLKELFQQHYASVDQKRTLQDNDNSITIPHSRTGKVIGLKLKSNNLLGRIPATLWDLPNLNILHVSQNSGVDVAFVGASDTLIEVKMHQTATSSITGISRYPNLLSVHMSDNQLGQISFPTELFQLTKLNNLHMANCELEGQVPQEIYKLELLRELNLYDNELTGLLPAGLEYLEKLQLLTLSKNHFRGRLPEWLNNLTNLQQLYLEYNQLTGQLVPLDAAPYLTRVYLDNNEFSENIPANFLGAVQVPEDDATVIRVNLDNNQLGDFIPDTLENLSHLPLKMTLAGNLFTSFQSKLLCDNDSWMDGLVRDYGCDAMVCPVGTTATLGRHTATSGCNDCDSATHLGQFACYDQDDRRTLQFLYAETGGDHWHRNDGWLQNDVAVCDWYGIKCYTENEPGPGVGRVKRIELPNNGLIGSISEQIYALNVLVTLDVSWNRISFPFQGLDKTTSLHILNIGHTDTKTFDGLENGHEFFTIFLADHLDISGTIPSQLFKNTNLEILSMNNCDISGTISTEIGALQNLRELYLWGNNLRGAIPQELTTLQALKIVSLAKNKLTGTLPEGLEGLPDLKAFSIKDQVTKGGGLTGNLLPFQYSEVLSTLILAGNKFDGSIPSALLSNVKTEYEEVSTLIVDISDNQLTGSVPGALSKFDQMDLFVQDNFLTSVDQQLCSKRDWMYGNVGEYGCDAILCPKYTASLLGRQAFDSLDCQSCSSSSSNGNMKDIVGQTKCGGKDSVLTERQSLELLYNNCGGKNWVHQENWMSTGEFCDWFGIACDDARSVVSIVLGANNMGGTIPTEIFLLPNLKRLSVFANAVDFSFVGIENAVNLKSLILDGTRVTSIAGVGNARGLTELNVRANRLVGPLPDELNKLNNLESLVLSDNQFEGPLPLWLGNLNNLMTLMLSNNQLTGNLISFNRFSGISLLGLANNQLEGPIPSTFLLNAFEDSKIFVDISGNRLSGALPKDLQRLNSLSIHLKNNQLTSIDDELCRMEAWNDYDVQSYGCDGLLCPVGTFNKKGRQSSIDDLCESCGDSPSNDYMGQTQCSAAAARLLFGGIMAVTTAVLGFALCL